MFFYYFLMNYEVIFSIANNNVPFCQDAYFAKENIYKKKYIKSFGRK